MRRIAHLDMDAFYASVELLRYPQLKGLPMVIGGAARAQDDLLARLKVLQPERTWGQADWAQIPLDFFPRLSGYTGRGVITTATYAARQFGVGSAMGLMKAARLCPQAILLPVDFQRYKYYSSRFKAVVAKIAPHIEDRGVDEIYIDFSEVPGGLREDGRVLAQLIQKAVFEETGLTCSIGVAPNKLLAKMASEFNKPNGITILCEADIPSKVWPLACRKINGIGPRADEKLKNLGIQTIGALAQQSSDILVSHFGQKTGLWMLNAARGWDQRPVVRASAALTVSRETTFDRDLHAVQDKTQLSAIFTQLCLRVAQDLQRKGYVGKTIGVKLRFNDFKSITRDQTLSFYTNDPQQIRRAAGQCLKRAPLQKRLRLLGVRVGSLLPKDQVDDQGRPRTPLSARSARAASAIPQENQLF